MSFNDDASQLKWSDIRQHWFYDDLSLGGYRSPSVIPVITNIFTTENQQSDDDKVLFKIIDGTEAEINEYPWMVSLQLSGS